MTKHNPPPSQATPAEALLQAGATNETLLLKFERQAERRLAKAHVALADDEKRMQQFLQKVEASRAVVALAASDLRDCQLRRAAGPPKLEV